MALTLGFLLKAETGDSEETLEKLKLAVEQATEKMKLASEKASLAAKEAAEKGTKEAQDAAEKAALIAEAAMAKAQKAMQAMAAETRRINAKELTEFRERTEAVSLLAEHDFAGAITRMESSLSSLALESVAVVGAVAGIGFALFEVANHAAEAGKAMYIANKATGISVETLGGLQIAAQKANLDFGQVTKSMAHFADATSDLTTAMSPASKALGLLGIQGDDLAKFKLKSMDDKLFEVIDRLKGVTDGGERAAIASALLGARTERLIVALDGGSESLKDMSKEAQGLYGWTQKSVDADDAWTDKVEGLQREFGGFSRQLGEVVIPAVTWYLKGLQLIPDVIEDICLNIERWMTLLDIQRDKVTDDAEKLAVDTQRLHEYDTEIEKHLELMKGELEGEKKQISAEEQHRLQVISMAQTVELAHAAMADAIQKSHGVQTAAVKATKAAYESAESALKELTKDVDAAAPPVAVLTNNFKQDADAAKDATEMGKGYTEQLKLMEKVLEDSNRAMEKRLALMHEQLQTIGGREPGGSIDASGLGPQTDPTKQPSPFAEGNVDDTAPSRPSPFAEKADLVTNKATATQQAITGLSQAIEQMSGKFGKAGPIMSKFAEELQKMQEKQAQAKKTSDQFGDAQKKQGENATASATSQVAAFGMEAAGFIKNKRAQAIVMAVMETAKGLADLAIQNYEGAALDFASAAMYGVIAGTSGGGGGAKNPANVGGGASPGGGGGGGGQSVAGGGSMLGGGSGGGGYHQTQVNIYGGGITDTNNLQNLVTSLNQGSGSGTVRLNVSGTSATIPTPAY